MNLNEVAKRHPVLSQDEVDRLVRDGSPSAIEKLVKHNLGLVFKVASAHQHPGMDFDDLVQEGILGLMHALSKFDPDQGHTLATYATWWIRHAIQRASMDLGSIVRTPVHTQKERMQVFKAAAEYKAEHSEIPTDKTLAGRLGWTVEKLHKVTRTATTWDDSIPVDTMGLNGDPSHYAETDDTQRVVHEALDKLDPRDAGIIRRRHSLDNAKKATYQEIAGHMGCTRENVRQRQLKAERRLAGLLGHRFG